MIDERPGLRPKTVTLYRYLLRSHIAPYFPAVAVARLKLAAVRRWHKRLLNNGVTPVTTAKAYRLLRAIMNTAVDDGLIREPQLKPRAEPWQIGSVPQGCGTLFAWSCRW